MTRPARVRAALERIAETAPELLRAPERWSMPRDMSGFSDLEAKMLAAIHAAGLPKPEWEYRFDGPCCAHKKRSHRIWHGRGEDWWMCDDCDEEAWERESVIIDDDIHDFLVAVDRVARHEYKPAGRRWRFDFAWPAVKVAVECEGGSWSGGRHTTGDGFEKDAEKYNAALLAGWRVLRFTQRQITSGEALVLIERMLA